jgi:hypothetical protein
MEGDWRGRIEIKACILTDYSIATPVREYWEAVCCVPKMHGHKGMYMGICCHFLHK